MSTKTLLSALIAAALFSQAPKAEAGWISKALRGGGDALADVVTGGEHGRRRDRERAEAEARRAAEAAEAARKLKEENKRRVNEKIATLEKMNGDFNAILQYVGSAHSELEKVEKAAGEAVANASWWDRHGLPKISQMWADENESGLQALAIVENMLYEQSKLKPVSALREGQAVDPQAEKTQIDETNRFAQEMRESVHRLNELAKNSDREMKHLLAEAFGHVGYEKSEAMLLGVRHAMDTLQQTKAYTEGLSRYYESDLKSAREELAALDSQPDPVPVPVPVPQETQPVQKKQYIPELPRHNRSIFF